MSGEVVHDCPRKGESVTLCCGRSPFELPMTDRLTLDPDLVTCGAGGPTVADLDLAAIKARETAATKGPWINDGREIVLRKGNSEWGIAVVREHGLTGPLGARANVNAEFIARARTDVPALLAEVERLTQERDEARAEAARLRSALDGLTSDQAVEAAAARFYGPNWADKSFAAPALIEMRTDAVRGALAVAVAAATREDETA